jgi:hypothetical protein
MGAILACAIPRCKPVGRGRVSARPDRQSLRPKSLTYVVGMNCHPCNRNRPRADGSPHWTISAPGWSERQRKWPVIDRFARVSRGESPESDAAFAGSSSPRPLTPPSCRAHSGCLSSAATEWTYPTSNGSGQSVTSADGQARRCQSRTSGLSPSARQPLSRATASFRRCPSGGWSGRRTMAEVITAGRRANRLRVEKLPGPQSARS